MISIEIKLLIRPSNLVLRRQGFPGSLAQNVSKYFDEQNTRRLAAARAPKSKARFEIDIEQYMFPLTVSLWLFQSRTCNGKAAKRGGGGKEQGRERNGSLPSSDSKGGSPGITAVLLFFLSQI